MKRHIALIEDDDVLRANYRDILRGAGFDVSDYSGKAEGLQGLERRPAELVLLDVTLNGERDAGFDVCAELRRRDTFVPIVFLTSHDAEVDKISGLRLGADDYITKDVSFDYLIVRIEALFRRRDAQQRHLANGQQAAVAANAAGDSANAAATLPQFDNGSSTVTWRGKRVELTLTQYWMLDEVCRVPGVAKSHAELMRAAKIVVEPNTITAHIKAIRDSFRAIDPSFDHLRTERGRGYRWVSVA